MVKIREKQTDWKSIISEFFGTSGITLKREEDEMDRWEQENSEILSKSEGNIMKLEKILVPSQSKKVKQSAKTNLKAKSKEILIKDEKEQKVDNDINRER